MPSGVPALRLRAWNDPVPRVDVFNDQGRLVRRLVLPPRSRIVGFGRDAVYLVRSDADDLEWLQRVRM